MQFDSLIDENTHGYEFAHPPPFPRKKTRPTTCICGRWSRQ